MVRNMPNNGIKEKNPSFFQVLFSGVNNEHLGIPQKFLKHIVHELSEKATLKLKGSSDCSWTVKVSKTDYDAYLKDGWQEFLRDNSLGDNEFLVFHYEGKMHFSIEVFGKNGCERFSFHNIRSHQNSTIANGTEMPRGGPSKHPSPASSSKRPRPSNSCNGDSDMRSDVATEDSEASKHDSFRSNFPHFKRIIRQIYTVFIPTAFSREHFPQGKFEIILKNAEGIKWAVAVVPGAGSHYFCGGWKDFASANQISVGDICTFELLRRNKMLVRIFQKGLI